MLLLSKLRQYYRYYRNWQKYKKPSAKRKERLDGELRFYSQFIKKGDLCFDVGANIGDKTEIFLQLGAAVVAVEPQESCWRVLKRRFRNNDVYVVSKALDKCVGSKEFFIDRSHTISSMSRQWIDSVRKSGRFSTHKWNDKMIAETTTLDALIAEYGNPAFCKIDVEGFEFEVLQGLSQPIVAMSFEFVPEYLASVLNCVEHLSKLGEMTFNYCLGDSTDFALSSWADADEIINVLNSLPNELTVQGDVYVRSSSSEFE